MGAIADAASQEAEEPRGRKALEAPTHTSFGSYIRQRREALKAEGETLSVRRFAGELGIEPAYLSKIERDVFAPPSEELIVKIAKRLGENPDRLLAMGGKIASDLKDTILSRPELLGELLRTLRDRPDGDVREMLKEVRDGDW